MSSHFCSGVPWTRSLSRSPIATCTTSGYIIAMALQYSERLLPGPPVTMVQAFKTLFTLNVNVIVSNIFGVDTTMPPLWTMTFLNFWRTHLFVDPLKPLFRTSGDVCPGFHRYPCFGLKVKSCPGFQSQGGSLAWPLYSPLVCDLLTVRRSAWQLRLFDPRRSCI